MGTFRGISLFTANAGGSEELADNLAETKPSIDRQGLLPHNRRSGFGRSGDQLFQTGKEGLSAAAESYGAQVAAHVQNPVGESLLARKRIQHPLLNGVFRNQMNHRDRPRLVLAPGA